MGGVYFALSWLLRNVRYPAQALRTEARQDNQSRCQKYGDNKSVPLPTQAK